MPPKPTTPIDWPPKGLAKPAQRALAGAGITSLTQLATWTQPKLAELHGMGPNALNTLRAALAEKKLHFAKGK